jgi:hypothetical protein
MGLEITKVIICDSCGEDISPKLTSNPHKYILKLTVEDVAMHEENSAIYSIIISPPFSIDLYFCGIKCIEDYFG